MCIIRQLFGAVLAFFVLSSAVLSAESGHVLVRLGPEGAAFSDNGGRVEFAIDLTGSVPWRTFTLSDPARLVIDFSEVEWDDVPRNASAGIAEVNVGRYRPGWSRLVAVLREPFVIDSAEMLVGDEGRARLNLVLMPTTAEDFRTAAGAPGEAAPLEVPILRNETGRIRVALDAGHGGIDPGAEADGLREADLMLSFARRLKETLLRNGRFDVIMTREEDVFVPLERRLTLARASGADIFLSLHADALEDDAGTTSGMTVYTLSDGVTDGAALQLAERHARNDILSGVDLSAAEDEIAIVLMDLARHETTPRAEALAVALVDRF